MNKLLRMLTALCLTVCLSCCSAALAEVQAYANQPLDVYTGPGYAYLTPGSFLSAGAAAVLHTRVWNAESGQWWVQAEFIADGLQMRAYTEGWRFDADLSALPEEAPLERCYVQTATNAYAGPGQQYVRWSDPVPADIEAMLMEVEYGWGLIECRNEQLDGLWRVWVPLDTLNCCSCWLLTDDTYPLLGNTDQGGATLIVPQWYYTYLPAIPQGGIHAECGNEDSIQWVQQCLRSLDYGKLAVDGDWGSVTSSAVMRFKSDYGYPTYDDTITYEIACHMLDLFYASGTPLDYLKHYLPQ